MLRSQWTSASRAGKVLMKSFQCSSLRPNVRTTVRWRIRSSIASVEMEGAGHRLAKAQYYGEQCKLTGPPTRPLIIGVAGGTASGKTSVCQKIIENLQNAPDCFYKDLTAEEQENIANYNFDHPSAFDFVEILSKLKQLRAGATVDIPTYDFVTAARCEEVTHVDTADIILFDGILAFYDPEVRELFDLKIFVDVDADTRLARRVRRDIRQRGRTVEAVLDQYERTVKPSFESYIYPTKKHADIIIPRGVDNVVAIELLWQNIQFRIANGSPRVIPAHADVKNVVTGVS